MSLTPKKNKRKKYEYERRYTPSEEEFYKRLDLKEHALKKLKMLDVSISAISRDDKELMQLRLRGVIETLQELEKRME